MVSSFLIGLPFVEFEVKIESGLPVVFEIVGRLSCFLDQIESSP